MLTVKRAARIRLSSRLAPRILRSRGAAGMAVQPQTESRSKAEVRKQEDAPTTKGGTAAEQKHKKTTAELDQELQQKMSGIAGDGGAAGVEYEDGKPVAMKRSVRNNMFRYI
ncbi:hypothetical protein DL766_007242 [Monosporascus sp. MC13-8B]|uniref:Uncharacterized protein n=1 Tax=Monosporascus cannonballus TaxID=155416 RepID=A0ABY0HAN6_9PEZI|nr:hypothetical protein DL762_004950 [Monosporascus cannonballus]RYO90799.1 hypothetical protein DL763_005196 [Monosporascus cannonballus]RYP24636.1 hypothetical protein DL766_007242 [Monosporascus sp. MC13-8B]